MALGLSRASSVMTRSLPTNCYACRKAFKIALSLLLESHCTSAKGHPAPASLDYRYPLLGRASRMWTRSSSNANQPFVTVWLVVMISLTHDPGELAQAKRAMQGNSTARIELPVTIDRRYHEQHVKSLVF